MQEGCSLSCFPCEASEGCLPGLMGWAGGLPLLGELSCSCSPLSVGEKEVVCLAEMKTSLKNSLRQRSGGAPPDAGPREPRDKAAGRLAILYGRAGEGRERRNGGTRGTRSSVAARETVLATGALGMSKVGSFWPQALLCPSWGGGGQLGSFVSLKQPNCLT